MLNNIEFLLTYENIYLAANWGVLPFWIMLITMPNHGITKFFVHSIVTPLLLLIAYTFVAYQIYLSGNIFESFNLYLGLEDLYSLFSNDSILLIFWLHFLSISLFLGGWIVRDASKYFIPKIFTIISLILTYFSGPVGLFFYWLIRIIFSKKINFNE
jgi:hypothetical protein